jgi:hypothetical protein
MFGACWPHTVYRDHIAHNFGYFFQVIGRAGGHLAEYNLFGCPAAQQSFDFSGQLRARHQKAVFQRGLQRVAQSADTPGHNGDFLDRVRADIGNFRTAKSGCFSSQFVQVDIVFQVPILRMIQPQTRNRMAKERIQLEIKWEKKCDSILPP